MSSFNFTPYGPGLNPTDISQVSNDNFARVANSVNNIDNTNLSTKAGDLGGSWIAYTPTVAGATGTAYGRYTVIGKTVFVTARMDYTGAQTGSITVSLPTNYPAANQTVSYIGAAWAIDTGLVHRTGSCRILANGTVIAIFQDNNGNQWNATVPFTWGNTDRFEISIVYETA